MQVINLIGEFEVPNLEDDETIMQYVDRLIKVVNQIILVRDSVLNYF